MRLTPITRVYSMRGWRINYYCFYLRLGGIHVDRQSFEHGHDLAQGRAPVTPLVPPAGFDPGR